MCFFVFQIIKQKKQKSYPGQLYSYSGPDFDLLDVTGCNSPPKSPWNILSAGLGVI